MSQSVEAFHLTDSEETGNAPPVFKSVEVGVDSVGFGSVLVDSTSLFHEWDVAAEEHVGVTIFSLSEEVRSGGSASIDRKDIVSVDENRKDDLKDGDLDLIKQFSDVYVEYANMFYAERSGVSVNEGIFEICGDVGSKMLAKNMIPSVADINMNDFVTENGCSRVVYFVKGLQNELKRLSLENEKAVEVSIGPIVKRGDVLALS